MSFNLFKKKKVRFLGRGGILLSHEGIDYYIDSEMLDGKKYDLAVYTDTVKRNDNSEIVTGELKDEVLTFLLDYLRNKENLKIELLPKEQ